MTSAKPNSTALGDFLKALKIQNKDLHACFNDALAAAHLERLIAAHDTALLERLLSHKSVYYTESGNEPIEYVPVAAIRRALGGEDA